MSVDARGHRLTTRDIRSMNQRDEPIAVLTAYVDEAGVDIVLVGDSLAKVVLGQPATPARDAEPDDRSRRGRRPRRIEEPRRLRHAVRDLFRHHLSPVTAQTSSSTTLWPTSRLTAEPAPALSSVIQIEPRSRMSVAPDGMLSRVTASIP